MSKSNINCFNYVVAVSDSKKEKFYFFAYRVREREDLLSVITIPEGCSLHKIIPVETATEAHQIAEERNRTYKANGTYLYDD